MKNLFNRIALAFAALVLSVAPAFAQQAKGVVQDHDGMPVIGAAVMVRGTSIGTTTGLDGEWELSGVKAGAVLEISSIGYITKTVALADAALVILEEDTIMLEDVVVVGYGVQKKSVVTAAIAKVGSDELGKTAPVRVDNALKGLAAGVNVTSSSGQPGAAARIRVRGTGTINNSDPLYIVDGMPIEGGIDYLNPSDIESIEVLKDAASGAVYGARAANGVILVTTKRGTKGDARVNYDFSYGLSSPWKKLAVLDASQYAMMLNEGMMNAGMAPAYSFDYSAYGKGTDWQDEIFNYNAPQSQHELSVSGASDKVNYYLSLGYLSQDGIIGGNVGRSNYDRLTLRSNTTYEVMDKTAERSFLNKFTLGSNLSYAYIKSTGISTNSTWGSPLGSAVALSPILNVYADDTEAAKQISTYGEAGMLYGKNGQMYTVPGGSYNEMVNPVAALSLPGTVGWSHKFVGGFSGELQIIEGLKLRSALGIDLSFWGDDGYQDVYYLSSSQQITESYASSNACHSMVWQVENTLTYNKSFGDHSVTALLGQSAKASDGAYLGASSKFLKDINKPYIDYTNGLQADGDRNGWGAPYAQAKLASYFARLSYNYAERYMAELTVRRDGSSRFGANNHWATFPSVSLGWNLFKEDFMQGVIPSLSNAKLRASWGQNGNENIGNFRYTVLTEGNNNYIYGTDESEAIGVKAGGLANQSLRWETSTQTDLGLDLGFFANKLTFTVDYYNKLTEGMLMTMPIPSYVGESKPIGNVGRMSNSGVEFELGYKYTVGDWNFRVNANATYLKNLLIEYGNDTGWANYDSFQGTGTISRAENGYPFPFFYGYQTDGIFQNDAEVAAYTWTNPETGDVNMIQPKAVAGDVRFKDLNNDGTINDDDRTYIGKGTPDWTFGLNFQASWKNFDFSMLVQGVAGVQVFDCTRRTDIKSVNLPAYMLNRWTGEGTSNKYPRFVVGDIRNWVSSDLYVYDGSYARIKNVQLGYTLPESLVRKALISSVRVYVAAENLLTLTPYHGFDPEIASGGTSLGIDYGVYPQARTFTAGVSVAF
ncbi:MAG: TonB-dependent receptor [Bacteroidales bacterium]|nr:TonB-dependent receptor [Bacteroidales bacterium]